MKNRISILLIPVIFCLFSFAGPAGAEIKPVVKGSQFPSVTFKDGLSKEERSYLRLARKTNFSLKDIGGTLFIIEVFSTYCTSCPKNVTVLNNVYSAIEKDPGLKGKVTLMGIAVGNTQVEAEGYKTEHKVLFPVITDLHFTAHKALGNPRVPYTILVRRNARDMVVQTHQGVMDSSDYVLNNVRGFLFK